MTRDSIVFSRTHAAAERRSNVGDHERFSGEYNIIYSISSYENMV